ncbi:hypothetical protein [Chryseobacterium sp. Leaf394]|uniref:hypothetical protein n=1 Tax=Chryseobacterium sp. Leaf394 TaxID=1736361 RepID=UPI0006FF124C|nr:hypothetical protein [Chryseobacterium sp. Leaf394]KQS92060.1 hypothetical protein ASG21_06290 [Chryseobacterium sp. Leaf394]
MNNQKELLKNILWNFQEKKFLSVENFLIALKNYNEKITGKTFIENLHKTILNVPKVTIQYEYWDEEIKDSIEPDFLLKADNNIYFTTAELLFKIHNEVCTNLEKEDHHFFEGLDLWTGENTNYPNIPLYFLQQGS